MIKEMGRRAWSNRLTVEQCLPLRISDLGRAGVFRAELGTWCSCQWTDHAGKLLRFVAFRLVPGDEEFYLRFRQEVGSTLIVLRTVVDETVRLTTTLCNFGGQRRWFCCPKVTNGKPCGKRVGVLYLPPGVQDFGCRRCYGLTYLSVQQHDKRLDMLLRLPVEELRKVLVEDAVKLGTLGIRISAILVRRLRKKAATHRNRRPQATRCFHSRITDNLTMK